MKSPSAAIAELAEKLSIVETETAVEGVTGRILAADVVADRDSPAADVSAMDGYALRMVDVQQSGVIKVEGESAPGGPPPTMQADAAVRIFTGAIVPSDCDVVVKREDTNEGDGEIELLDAGKAVGHGENIRRAGENAKAGSTVLASGVRITAAHQATMANFGAFTANVFRRVRVTILTTGDEVGMFRDATPEPWQLRNSNQTSIKALLSGCPWIDVVDASHAKDLSLIHI